jgi:hypothetical protein
VQQSKGAKVPGYFKEREDGENYYTVISSGHKHQEIGVDGNGNAAKPD